MSRSPKEIAFQGRVAEQGCIVCSIKHGVERQAAIHHWLRPREKTHWAVLPLCPEHHTDGFKTIVGHSHGTLEPIYKMISLHGTKKTFREHIGTELGIFQHLRKELTAAGHWPDWVEQKYNAYIENK